MEKEISYSYNPDGVNEVIEELSATSFLALREVKWSEEDTDYKTDLRRYFIKQDGTEMPGKGTAIGDPGKLAEVLVEHLYGSTKALIGNLAQRDDYVSAMGQYYADYSDEEYTDFKEELDSERSKAIIDRGMGNEEFMETLK